MGKGKIQPLKWHFGYIREINTWIANRKLYYSQIKGSLANIGQPFAKDKQGPFSNENVETRKKSPLKG